MPETQEKVKNLSHILAFATNLPEPDIEVSLILETLKRVHSTQDKAKRGAQMLPSIGVQAQERLTVYLGRFGVDHRLRDAGQQVIGIAFFLQSLVQQ